MTEHPGGQVMKSFIRWSAVFVALAGVLWGFGLLFRAIDKKHEEGRATRETHVAVTRKIHAANGLEVGFAALDESFGVPLNSMLQFVNQSTKNDGVVLTGWTIESSSGSSYTIPQVTKKMNYKGSQVFKIPPEDITIRPLESLFVSLHGTPDDDYVHTTEQSSYGVYTGAETWSTFHDTIIIKDAAGTVVGEFNY